jgi:hypothetical protein
MVSSRNTGQGGDQALYDGFGAAAGMHCASAAPPPFGQVRHEPAPSLVQFALTCTADDFRFFSHEPLSWVCAAFGLLLG